MLTVNSELDIPFKVFLIQNHILMGSRSTREINTGVPLHKIYVSVLIEKAYISVLRLAILLWFVILMFELFVNSMIFLCRALKKSLFSFYMLPLLLFA